MHSQGKTAPFPLPPKLQGLVPSIFVFKFVFNVSGSIWRSRLRTPSFTDLSTDLCKLEYNMVRILNGKFFVQETSSICSNVVPPLQISEHRFSAYLAL